MKEPRHKRKKRRTCYDRLRARFLRARRVHRPDPAASAAMQLLALFTVLFARLPETIAAPSYIPYSSPCRSATMVQRSDLALRLGVPVRYLHLALAHGKVPQEVLFDHIRKGGVLRRDAMIELRKHAPEAALDWLTYIQKHGRWSDLIRCLVPDSRNDNIDVKLLQSTLAWLSQPTPDKVGCTTAGHADNTTAGSTSVNSENDDDPTKPKGAGS